MGRINIADHVREKWRLAALCVVDTPAVGHKAGRIWHGERGTGGGGGTQLLLALVVLPLSTHPFPVGAPFLLLTGTPPLFGWEVTIFSLIGCCPNTARPRPVRANTTTAVPLGWQKKGYARADPIKYTGNAGLPIQMAV